MIDQCPFSITVAIKCITVTIQIYSTCTCCVTKLSQRFLFEYHRDIYRYIKQHKRYHSRKSVAPTKDSYILKKKRKGITSPGMVIT